MSTSHRPGPAVLLARHAANSPVWLLALAVGASAFVGCAVALVAALVTR